MKCKNCKNEIPSGTMYCPMCGTPIKAAVPKWQRVVVLLALWVLTVFMAISGLLYFNTLAGPVMLIFALLCCPSPMVQSVYRDKGFRGPIKTLVLVVLFVVSLCLVPPTEDPAADKQRPDTSLTNTDAAPETPPTRQPDAPADKQPDTTPTRQPADQSPQQPDTTPTQQPDTPPAQTPADPPAKEPDSTPAQQPEDQTGQQEGPASQEPSDTSPQQPDKTPSDGDGNGNGENFNTYDNKDQQETAATWVLNTSTMKIHYPSCKSVKKIAPQNYATSNLSESELISRGYSVCGQCH